MTKLKRTLPIILGLLISFLPSLSSHADGVSLETNRTQTITVPLTTWNELKSNNEKALSLIRQSRIPLNESQDLINKQASDLQELKSISNKQVNELMKAKNDLMKQKAYLREMNNSLEMLNKDIKKNRETEQRLHRQRNTWVLISGLLLVGLAVK